MKSKTIQLVVLKSTFRKSIIRKPFSRITVKMDSRSFKILLLKPFISVALIE